MGFGISDEVLEKIIMEPWVLPSELGYNTSYSNNISYHPRKLHTKLNFPQKTVRVDPPKSNATTKEQENITFVKAIIKHMRNIYADGLYDSLYSIDVKHLFDNVNEYFESVATTLNISIDKDNILADQNQRSLKYIFQGITDQIFFIITHESLDKVQFRNIVSDVYLLMKTWGFNLTGETIKKKVFFAFYADQFGLSESKFHCCPHCGSKLYSGIKNCPSCLRNIHSDTATCKNSEEPPTIVQSAHESNNEIYELCEQLRLAQETIQVQSTEINARKEQFEDRLNELTKKIESLQKQIQEKDQAINAYKDHIVGTTQDDESQHLKILVIGEFFLTEQETKSITNSVGISYNALEFYSEYTKIKNFASRIKGDTKYAAIIVGAVPHKVKNLDGANSLSALFRREGYPFMVEARTFQGELKFSKESFQRSLSKVAGHLLSKGLLL